MVYIMEIFIDIVAVILGIVGLLGCLLPVLPGPPCSLAGMFLLFLWGSPCAQDDITWRLLIIMLIVTVIVTVLDYVVPGWLTRVTGGTKYASRGATAGMLVGILFFPPWGMIVGAFIGALGLLSAPSSVSCSVPGQSWPLPGSCCITSSSP